MTMQFALAFLLAIVGTKAGASTASRPAGHDAAHAAPADRPRVREPLGFGFALIGFAALGASLRASGRTSRPGHGGQQ